MFYYCRGWHHGILKLISNGDNNSWSIVLGLPADLSACPKQLESSRTPILRLNRPTACSDATG